MKAWLAAFDTFEAMRPKTIVPAHGAVGDGSLIPDDRAVMQGIQARVRELKAQGRPVDEIAATVQMELTTQYPGFARANGAAGAARAAYREAPMQDLFAERRGRSRRPGSDSQARRETG